MLLTTWTEDQVVTLFSCVIAWPFMAAVFMLAAIVIDDNDDEGGFQ